VSQRTPALEPANHDDKPQSPSPKGNRFAGISVLDGMATAPSTAASDRGQRFDALVRPHVLQLYMSAYRLVGKREDAEDLVQDMLVKLYPRTEELANVRDLRPWLLRVLYNQFVDRMRQQSRMPNAAHDEDLLESVADPAPNPEAVAADAELTEKIGLALDTLHHSQRALVTMHVFGGHSLEELTKVFGVPVGTLKSRMHRAKATLKVSLAPLLGEWNPFR
jgi:RNA polymerase sigma factor (sigma-70 family)